MSGRAIRGAIRFSTYKIITSGNYTAVNESVVVVDKTVGAATTVTLPPSLPAANLPSVRKINVVDGKGDANVNPITVAAAGTDTINGAATAVITASWSALALRDTGGGAWVTAPAGAAGAGLAPAKFSTINVTTGTLAAGNASGADAVFLTSTGATPGAQAMRTPAQILTDTPGLAVGASYALRVTNTGAGTFTLATDSGAGFTMTGAMAVLQNTWSDFVVTISTATTGVVQQVAFGQASSPLPPAKFTSINVTTGTLAAGNASGAANTFLMSTNAVPGSQAMRTPAQILADTPGLFVGDSYTLRVTNTGAGAFTLATDAGAGFTMSSAGAIAQNTWRDFVVTIVTATTGTVQGVGVGTFS